MPLFQRAQRPGSQELLPLPEVLRKLGEPGHFAFGVKQNLLAELAIMDKGGGLPGDMDPRVATIEGGFPSSVLLNKRSPLTPIFSRGKHSRWARGGNGVPPPPDVHFLLSKVSTHKLWA